MLTIKTQQGKEIEILLQTELDDPIDTGDHIRAYCHLHGSDHQRSMSIDKASGWGHCFNATCDATVLVADWNMTLAKQLIQSHYQGLASRKPVTSTRHQPRQVALTVVEHTPHIASAWQRDELSLLLSMQEYMRAGLLHSQRAQAYLEQRKIPLELAQATGVGYLPATIPERMMASPEQKRLLYRWTERLIFPLSSPSGKGYIGRSLWGWKAGMDENVHKARLEEGQAPKRWIKTNPAGWFGFVPGQLSESLILVEGAFDRLTLLAAGFRETEVIALVGTAARPSWFPKQVKTVILALDADEGGRDAMQRLAERIARAGYQVSMCAPVSDRWGKDWNERWQRIGSQSVWPLYEAYASILAIA